MSERTEEIEDIQSTRPEYSPPDFESEEIFEKRALACGKCRSGPHIQYACMRLASVS